MRKTIIFLGIIGLIIILYFFTSRKEPKLSPLQTPPPPYLVWNSNNSKAYHYTEDRSNIVFNFELHYKWPFSEVSYAYWDDFNPDRIFILNKNEIFLYNFIQDTNIKVLSNDNTLKFLQLNENLIVLTPKNLLSINILSNASKELFKIDLPEIPGHGPPTNLTKVSESTFLLEIPDKYFMLTGDKKYYLGNANEIKPYQVEPLSIN